MHKFKLVLVILLGLLSLFLRAQQPVEKYELYLSNNLSHYRSSITSKLKSVTSISKMKAIILSEIKASSGMVAVRILQKGETMFWRHRFGKPIIKTSGYLVTGTRGDVEIYEFYQPAQFHQVLKDTIVVIDTLKISVFLKAASYNPKRYYLLAAGKKAPFILFNENEITLATSASWLQKGSIIPVKLKNTSAEEETLSSFRLYIPTTEDLNYYRDIALQIKASHPDYDRERITKELSSYISVFYGKVTQAELIRFTSNFL